MTLPTTPAARMAIESVRTLRGLVLPEVRELGDLRRNAALYLAKMAGDDRSSFSRGLHTSLDAARLGELPYLASLGYLLAVGLLPNASTLALKNALDQLSRRPARTPERTGYADDPVCACGLLLLARAAGDDAFARLVQEGLGAFAGLSPAENALLCATTSAPQCSTAAPGDPSPERLASALLLSRIDEQLARQSFPGLPADLEGHLLGAVSATAYAPMADLGAMLVLAGLELSLKVPDEGRPDAEAACDVAVVVALKEEFRILFERFRERHTHVVDGDRAYYVFDVPTQAGARSYRCVAVMVGEMGTNRTGVIVEKVLGRWSPSAVVLVGIAGGIHGDVRLGDVIVASEVNNYLEGAKVGGASGSAFQRGSDSFKTSNALLDRVRNLEFAGPAHFHRWQAGCGARRAALPPNANALVGDGLLREKPAQREGHIASGPLVVTSREFVAWIREGDRSCLGVEMEAGGLVIATHMDPSGSEALVIRGVSDFGDDRKAKLDDIGEGVLRQYAMQNAVEFLWCLMEAGVLPQRPGGETPPASAVGSKVSLEEALLRALQARADEDGEVTAQWRDIRGWLGDPIGDVHAAAIHLKQDGHFHSAMFESGPDGYCTVVLRR